jgi:two-component system chemotaxis response regulator CheY
LKALKVLVVEDDDALRTFYQLSLIEQGHAVSAVENGAEALKVLSPDIDVVVTNMMMPVMSGDELIAALRAQPEYREIPILVVTAHPSAITPALRNGKTTVLRKPFQLDDFIRWVDLTARLARSDN